MPKLLALLSFFPWAYFVVKILREGYVFHEPYMTGPTVSSMLWLPGVLMRAAAVARVRRSKSDQGNANHSP
jgi:hypothetical protein